MHLVAVFLQLRIELALLRLQRFRCRCISAGLRLRQMPVHSRLSASRLAAQRLLPFQHPRQLKGLRSDIRMSIGAAILSLGRTVWEGSDLDGKAFRLCKLLVRTHFLLD